ncbi:MAG TPA: thioredoxin domain-containing protein [Longimicrobium sp.]|nr:thioredoxin domain-containing protein [Longimicrobium sp.]
MARPAPQKRRPSSSLKPFYAVLGALALAGIVLLVLQLRKSGGTPATTLTPVVMSPEQLQRVPGISKGQPNAPVVIMEFADFQCPSCGDFARFAEPLLQEWIDNGTVRFVYYDFPLVQIHRNAMLSARAGRCANEQGRFWPYHDRLYGQQQSWAEQPNGKAADMFIEYARLEGLDAGAFAECLRSNRFQKEVSESYQFGTTMEVGGTPTLFINGKRMNQRPTNRAEWEELIRQEMGDAAPAAAPAAAAANAPSGDSALADTATSDTVRR